LQPSTGIVCKIAEYLYRFIDCYYALMGTIGFVDDYIKIFKKKRFKRNFKVFGQVGLGPYCGDSTLL
jgi:UDP-N-acetylmuramyl pentapeptide phosphotransferase/UDP-N-acetylglucosamine-1-phosphate transferase